MKSHQRNPLIKAKTIGTDNIITLLTNDGFRVFNQPKKNVEKWAFLIDVTWTKLLTFFLMNFIFILRNSPQFWGLFFTNLRHFLDFWLSDGRLQNVVDHFHFLSIIRHSRVKTKSKNPQCKSAKRDQAHHLTKKFYMSRLWIIFPPNQKIWKNTKKFEQIKETIIKFIIKWQNYSHSNWKCSDNLENWIRVVRCRAKKKTNKKKVW